MTGSRKSSETKRVTFSLQEILTSLKNSRNETNRAGMARFGINTQNAYGISVTELRKMAKKIGTEHQLAQQLWASGIHEARILASIVDDPMLVTEKQMDDWAVQFDSWDICDLCCSNLFDKTPYAYDKAVEWTHAETEFVKRAGYTLMAALSVHDKEISDKKLAEFFPYIKKGATDERNFVKKAVNWALRQIGKRDLALNRTAIKTAKEIGSLNYRSARWIAADALHELQSDAVQSRLRTSSSKKKTDSREQLKG